MAAAPPPGDTLLRATANYKPRTPLGLSFRRDCFFVVLMEHAEKDDPRRGLYFVYDVAGRYGYIARKWVVIHSGPPPEDPRMGVAYKDFVAETEQQLSLQVGDVVEITDRAPTGWYFGNLLNGSSGWFSKNFIHDWFEFDRYNSLTFQFVVQARRGQLEQDGYLPFSAFEFMDVIRIPHSNDDEWIGRNSAGRIGRIRKDRLKEGRRDLPSVLLKHPWYHSCSRAAATSLVEQYLHRPNHFLIRDSSEKGNFAITVTNGERDGLLNVFIAVSLDEYRYEIEGKPFTSLEELVDFYSTHPIHRDERDGRQIFLHQRIIREGWVDPTVAASAE